MNGSLCSPGPFAAEHLKLCLRGVLCSGGSISGLEAELPSCLQTETLLCAQHRGRAALCFVRGSARLLDAGRAANSALGGAAVQPRRDAGCDAGCVRAVLCLALRCCSEGIFLPPSSGRCRRAALWDGALRGFLPFLLSLALLALRAAVLCAPRSPTHRAAFGCSPELPSQGCLVLTTRRTAANKRRRVPHRCPFGICAHVPALPRLSFAWAAVNPAVLPCRPGVDEQQQQEEEEEEGGSVTAAGNRDVPRFEAGGRAAAAGRGAERLGGRARGGLLQPHQPDLRHHQRLLHRAVLPRHVGRPQYMNLLMDWIEVQINNEDIFPTNVGTPFPRNFLPVVKKILSRLFRVFVHVYIHHFDRITQMGSEAHVNTCYKHFYYFVKEFNLIDTKELEPLKEMTAQMCH
uniref:MOB kinase activator 3A n=1 Tax=Phasianus colchicus TaxID=9054 RepID=A0A669QVA9_PHACC